MKKYIIKKKPKKKIRKIQNIDISDFNLETFLFKPSSRK